MPKKICPNCGKVVDIYNHKCPKAVPAYIKEEQLIKRRKQQKEKRKQRNALKKYFNHLANDESESTKELRSKHWYWFRQQILLRDGEECQRHLIKFNQHVYAPLEVHHIKPRETHPELMYDPNNVVTLCKSCNAKMGLNGIDFDFTPESLRDFE